MVIGKRLALAGFYFCLLLLLASLTASAQTFTCSPCAVSVTGTGTSSTQNGTPYPSTLNVSGVAGTVSTITLELDGLTSNGSQGLSTAQLGVMLESPGAPGKFLEVLGNPSDSLENLSNVTLKIADGGPAMPNGGTPWPGTTGTLGPYSPTSYSTFSPQDYSSPGPGTPNSTQLASQGNAGGSGTLNGVFGGISANGDWHLLFIDNTGTPQDNISITGWKLTITANAANTATVTTLSSNLNPSFTASPNNSVTLTATVTGSPSPSGGTVNFKDGINTISGCGTVPLSGGTAACFTTFATEGNHSLSAIYSGAGTFNGSSSSGVNQFVKNHSTLSGAQYCNPGTLTVPGGNLATATPAPSIINIGTDTTALSNAVSTVSVGINNLVADQAGGIRLLLEGPGGQSLEFWGSAGNLTPTSGNFFIEDSAASQFPISGNITAGTYLPTAYTQGDTFLSGPSPAPQVPASFVLATPAGNPNAGTFSSVFNAAVGNGDWKLFAFYNGGTGHTLTIGNWCLDITEAVGAATTTTLNASPTLSLVGSPVTLTATVNSNTTVNTGTVTFTENGLQLASPVAVVSGHAALNTSNLSEGDHTIVATYNDGTTFALSFGQASLRVDNAPTVTAGGNTYTYCNPGTIAIPGPHNASNIGPGYPNPSNILVTNIPGTLTKATVKLNSYQVFNPDIVTSLLVGPTRTTPGSLDFFSAAGGASSNPAATLTFDDAAAGLVPASGPTTGTYKPTSYSAGDTFTTDIFYTLPPGPYLYAANSGSSTLASTVGTVTDPDGIWSLYFNQTAHGSGGTISGWCVNLTENPPVLGITKGHVGDFSIGQTDAQYTINVHNNGPGSTGSAGGPVVVTDVLPTGMTATAATGIGWNCSTGTSVSCSRSDALVQNGDYPAITITVTVGATTATPTVTNNASVIGGGAAPANAGDPTTILSPPAFTVTKSHSGNFIQSQTGVWTITIKNTGTGSTTGTATLSDTLPSGYTLASFTGTGWGCTGTTIVTCSSSTVVIGGDSYPAINLTVNVPANSPASVDNMATASGGGALQPANSNTDSVTVNQVAATIAATGGTPQSASINTAFAVALQATVKDAGNNPVSGASVVFTAPASGASGAFGNSTATITVLTNGSGIASATFTANGTTGGPYTVTATGPGPIGPANFSLTNTAGAASTIAATGGTPQSVTINTAFAPLQATVKDSGGNPVSGASVIFTAPASGASGTFSNNTNTITILTSSSGIASATFTANGTAGAYTVGATGPGPIGPANFSLANNAGAASTIAATGGTPQSASINTAFSSQLQATVKDSGGNPVSGASVIFSAPASGASGTFSNNTNTITIATNPSGVASAPFTANGTAGGSYTVTATGPGPIGPASFSLTNTAGSAATITATGGTPQSVAVNTAFAALQATVKDSGGNPVSGASVVFTAPASGASGTFSNNTNTITVATNPSGVASATFTANSTAGGPYNVTATGPGPIGPANFSLTNTAGSAATIATFAGTPQTTNVNTAFPTALQAKVTDSGGNPVFGASVVFTSPASGASGTFSNSAATITVATNPSGIASAGFTANGTAGGPYSVTATNSPAGTTNFQLTNSQQTEQITVGTSPVGRSFSVDSVTYTTTQTFTWNVNDTHTVATTTPQAGTTGTQYVWSNWSDAGAISHTITVPASSATYTANFATQYLLTTSASPAAGGSVTPSSGFYNSGTAVPLQATSNTGYIFASWTGNVANSASPSTSITMTAPQTVTANFPASVPDMTISKSHSGNFTQGQTGASYMILVGNAGSGPTNNVVTVTDTLPAGLTPTGLSGSGWSCTLSPLKCQRNTVLNQGGAYPAITLTVNVASNASASVTNMATVSGGGESNTGNNIALDPTTISVAGLSFSTGTVNFGTVTRWGGTSQYLTVTNQGTTTIRTSRIFLSNLQNATTKDLTYDGGCMSSLAPGKSCKITLSLWPSMTGAVSAILNLQDNAPGSPQQIGIVANVIAPKADPDPSYFDFGTHTVNSTSVKNFTFSNQGLGTLTINSISVTGSNSADFTQTNNCGGSLAQNASCTVAVIFKPKAKDSRSATLKFTDNAQSSTQTVSLSGKGN